MMLHPLVLQAGEGGKVLLVCTAPGHDWTQTIETAESVNAARNRHDTEVRAAMKPGLYLVNRIADSPQVYLLLPDRSWKYVPYWVRAMEPSLEHLTPLAELDDAEAFA